MPSSSCAGTADAGVVPADGHRHHVEQPRDRAPGGHGAPRPRLADRCCQAAAEAGCATTACGAKHVASKCTSIPNYIFSDRI